MYLTGTVNETAQDLRSKIKAKKELTIEMGSQILLEWLGVA